MMIVGRAFAAANPWLGVISDVSLELEPSSTKYTLKLTSIQGTRSIGAQPLTQHNVRNHRACTQPADKHFAACAVAGKGNVPLYSTLDLIFDSNCATKFHIQNQLDLHIVLIRSTASSRVNVERAFRAQVPQRALDSKLGFLRVFSIERIDIELKIVRYPVATFCLDSFVLFPSLDKIAKGMPTGSKVLDEVSLADSAVSIEINFSKRRF